MKALVSAGDVIGATVEKINGGLITLSLDTDEEAKLYWRDLSGRTNREQSGHQSSLKVGSKLTVRVTEIYLGRNLRRQINVCPVAGDTTTPNARAARPADRQQEKHGLNIRTPEGIRVWRDF